TAWPIGVERGWITRDQARDITLRTLRFLEQLPQGELPSGVAGYRGFYYHFLDMETGLRFGATELSTIDSTWLQMGIALAQGWFDRTDESEKEIRALAQRLLDRTEWDWMQTHSKGGKAITMGWSPESGFIERNWDGYNEGMALYFLALGSRSHPVKDGAYEAWTAPFAKYWRGEGAKRHLSFGPHFVHQYAAVWIDYRGIYDATMRAAGFDYFENSRRATYAQRSYAMANPMGWDGYSKDIWGLSACDGPGELVIPFKGKPTQFLGYAAYGPKGMPDEEDRGTLAPTAAVASIPFAPEIAIQAARALRTFAGGRLYGTYGFFDAFNPSFRDTQVRVVAGSVDARSGWVGSDYLSDNQGPILGMIANFKTGILWNATRNVPNLVRGMRRAGFAGGWLTNTVADGH
ncbi:MAG TPA: glucoamylase family protein, partial [Nitrospiraceae bacterium]|nr:glucoamylase family protein [Nitrospiraceae bacterium]